jgi:hypothetical protein
MWTREIDHSGTQEIQRFLKDDIIVVYVTINEGPQRLMEKEIWEKTFKALRSLGTAT